MRQWLMLVLGACALCGQTKPEGLPISTWVREDLFAGFLANDMQRLERGVKKLDSFLAGQPSNSIALAWRGGVSLYRAVRAHEGGDQAGFDTHYAAALKDFRDAKPNPGTFAIEGGSFTVLGDRLPQEQKPYAHERAYTQYKALEAAQAKFFENLPLHFRGEVLAGIAQAAQRLGRTGEAQAYMQKVVSTLPGSIYERRVRLWMQKPEAASKTQFACQTCHEEGRLKNRMPSAAE